MSVASFLESPSNLGLDTGKPKQKGSSISLGASSMRGTNCDNQPSIFALLVDRPTMEDVYMPKRNQMGEIWKHSRCPEMLEQGWHGK